MQSSCTESEENMSLNKKRIRRTVKLNDTTVWVTADTEQEYADKLMKIAGAEKNGSGENTPSPSMHTDGLKYFLNPMWRL